MNNFRLWLENQSTLSALVARVIADRYDDAPRLILADWFDEHGEPFGELIRLANDKDNAAFEHKFKECWKWLIDHNVNIGGIAGVTGNEHISNMATKELYMVRPKGIYIHRKSNNTFSLVDPSKLDENVLRAIMTILSHRKVKQNHESITDFNNAVHRFVSSLNHERIKNINISSIGRKRLTQEMSNLLHVAPSAKEADKYAEIIQIIKRDINELPASDFKQAMIKSANQL